METVPAEAVIASLKTQIGDLAYQVAVLTAQVAQALKQAEEAIRGNGETTTTGPDDTQR